MSIIYGPVSSWRLGRSLGVDLLNTKSKVCSFNCVYCQLGNGTEFFTEPEVFISLEQLSKEIRLVQQTKADYATFSGMGEPTLAINLGEAIELVRSMLDLTIAVLTNTSLIFRGDVRQQLNHANTVVAKLDVPNDEMLAKINRPAPGLNFNRIKDGIRIFRDMYKGKLALQVMFIEANKDYASEIAALASEISPDEVQINTPLRPCKMKPLPRDDIASIREKFNNLRNVITVYDVPKPEIKPLDLAETLRRRPKI